MDYEGKFEPDFDQLLHEEEMDRITEMAAAAIVIKVCDGAKMVPPNPIALGHAVEILRGLTPFNAEQMITRSLTGNGLDIARLRKLRQEFDQKAA